MNISIKIFLVISVLLLTLSVFAQIPDGYYDNAEGKTGDELKTALYNIIKGHVEYPYTASTTDVWDIIKETDRDTANPDNVILLYSGLSVNAAQEYNNANGWTREHVWAKSHGDFGTDPGPGTDLHHLRPECDNVNSARNNRWFAECNTPVYYNGVNTGCFTSNTQYVWKPRKEVIGDVARMMFYMATRYEGENGEPDLELVDYIPSDDNSKEPIFALLSDLLKWSAQDPVDDFERNRNEVIYKYQKNRNPFIDHPEYVQMIWRTITEIPAFVSIADSIAIVGEHYEYVIIAIDSDTNSEILFNLNQAPDWLHINQTGDGTATLSGTPGEEDLGDFLVVIEATNGVTDAVRQQFYLNVSKGNNILTRNVSEIKFLPNPANDFISYTCDRTDGKVQIFNSLGILVGQQDIASGEICVSHLAPGLYLLRLQTAEIQHSSLILVQH
jgi:endonuclease I